MEITEIVPFESEEEQKNYCEMCRIQFEENSVGFRFSSDEGDFGMCQCFLISHDAYILGIGADSGEENYEFLTKALEIIVDFFKNVKIRQISFPIVSSFQADVAEACGFEAVSDTLYVYAFDSFVEEDKFLDDDFDIKN